jgi:hypothetical protein
MNPVVNILIKGFHPDAKLFKKILAILTILLTFAASWYICLTVAAKMGVDGSNAWTV